MQNDHGFYEKREAIHLADAAALVRDCLTGGGMIAEVLSAPSTDSQGNRSPRSDETDQLIVNLVNLCALAFELKTERTPIDYLNALIEDLRKPANELRSED